MNWRLVLTADGTGYLVHVGGRTKAEALREGLDKAVRAFGLARLEIRVRRIERIGA